MLKRNILLILTIIGLMNFTAQNSYSIATPLSNTEINSEVLAAPTSLSDEETDVIKKVTFRDKLKKSKETQIENFYKKYNKYINKGNTDKLKDLYTENYLNNDGFNRDILFKLMSKSVGEYKKIKYNTEIKNVSITEEYAIVKVHETAEGETLHQIERIKDTGTINSDIYYIDYLKKEDGNWKISSTITLNEKVQLKYGEAKNIDFKINSPDCVPENSNYEVELDVDSETADGVFMVGSISNEPVVFPQKQDKYVYRALKNETLARVLKSNKDGNNEYATIAIAVTRAQVEPESVVINMTGIAFIMKRVNVLSLNKNSKFE